MKIVGCDRHARQQTIAMVDTETGEFTEKTLDHEGNAVRAFYAALESPVLVGIEVGLWLCYLLLEPESAFEISSSLLVRGWWEYAANVRPVQGIYKWEATTSLTPIARHAVAQLT
jgi:hypothetical protein